MSDLTPHRHYEFLNHSHIVAIGGGHGLGRVMSALSFIKERLNIKLFVHLIDARQFDLAIDKNLQNYLASFLRGDQKVVRLYTKADKLNQSERAKLLRHDPQAVLVSTLKGGGLAKAREIIVRGAFGL